MRADLRPTRENIVAVGWVLLLTFGALLIILAVCVYQWRQNNLRYSEFMAREKPLSDSFHAVYQKLVDKSSNPAALGRRQRCLYHARRCGGKFREIHLLHPR